MKNFLADQSVTLTVDFLVGGEFVMAAANSVTYTVRDNAGQAISGLVDVAVNNNAEATFVNLTIPALNNSISISEMAERRFVTVSVTDADGRSYTFYDSYRIHEFLLCAADEHTVRSILGLSASELPDEDIDIVEAYLALDSELPNTTLSDAYATPVAANALDEAVALTSALQLLPSLAMRAVQAKESDGSAIRRFQNANINQLRSDLSTRRSKAIEVFSGNDVDDMVRVAVTQDDTLFPGG